jgi:TonB-linked SusC/RagA family outer membrane protein
MRIYIELTKILKYVISNLLLATWLVIFTALIGIIPCSATASAQNINIITKNITINEVFKQIKKQTGYDVLWQKKYINTNKRIQVKFVQSSIDQVMQKCLEGQGLTYTIDEHTIVIKPKPISPNAMIYAKDSLLYVGKVIDEKSMPMIGASVKIKESNKGVSTTPEGNFSIYGPEKGATLIVSYIGYANKEISLNGSLAKNIILVSMAPGQNQLGEVSIVSTGYQDLPKERATGSFEVISKEQLQHSNDPNLVKRLEGIVTGIDFRNNETPTNSANQIIGVSPVSKITIRGKNTLEISNNASNTSGQVLVVIDGIASPYGIEQVNPDDVESITILRDAASASIWGSRAANGVIVIKTKRGSYDVPTSISFNTNINVTDKIDLFYKKYMSTSEFIDAEIYKFRTARTVLPNVTINNPRLLVSPVAEIMDSWLNKHTLSETQANAQLDVLRKNDIRNDYDKYLLRKAVTQNYNLSIDGGVKNMNYRLSGGYSKNLNNTVNSGSDRFTLGYNTSIRVFKNLELTANISYNQVNTDSQAPYSTLNGAYGGNPYYPYVRLADDMGNPLTVNWNYRQSFLDLISTTYGDKILDMSRTPLDELRNGGYSKTKSQSININVAARYKFNDVFSASVNYSPNWGLNEQEDLQRGSTFFMRNLVNRYTNPTTFQRNIPVGDLYIPQRTKLNNKTLRGQINADKIWNEKHALNVIAGVDIAQSYSRSSAEQYFGYNERTLSIDRGLNYRDNLPLLFVDAVSGSGQSPIPYFAGSLSDYRNRTIGVFSNAAYTYDRRYTISASLRQDQSSEFGGGTNRKGTPFYSFGTSWAINNEKFYNVDWLPNLKLRATFGYNGNVNPSATATPILTRVPVEQVDFGNFLGYAYTFTPTNERLRPERTGILNLGLDWGIKNNRLSGSIEYYNKQTKDLIAQSPVDPSSGFIAPSINNGNLRGEGIDLSLNSLNIQRDMFRWSSTFLFSYNRVKVTKLYSAQNLNAVNLTTDLFAYSEGYDLGRIFAYRWAGLDPNTGDPRGYLNGEIVTISNTSAGNQAYNDISSASAPSLRFFGSAVPLYFGSFRNTFNYGNLSLSFNILYKLGYWFRRPTTDVVSYDLLYRTSVVQGIEYRDRWQNPGDELHTNVPSAIYPASEGRDQFYRYSEVNVQKADHVRLQEIICSYAFKTNKTFIKNPRIYANVNNLGILWRANKLGLDPDILDVPNPRTYSIGFSANF